MAGVKGQLARTSALGLKSRRPAPHDGLATPQPAGGGLCGLPGFRGGVGEGGNGGCTVLPGPHCASQGYNCPLLKQPPPHLLLR